MSGAAQRKGGKLSLLIANATGLEVRRSQWENRIPLLISIVERSCIVEVGGAKSIQTFLEPW